MDIYEFHQSGQKYSISQIAADEELATDLQKVLIGLRLLDPPCDGKFGPISTEALREFQTRMGCAESGTLDTDTAKKLIETSPLELPPPRLKPGNDLAGRIIKYMQLKNYHISTKPEEYNIVYVEGMNSDGTENDDAPNHFNDRRIVIEIVDGIPIIKGMWEATTEPGTYYTDHPMNPKGAARIQFNQFKAWKVGPHKNQCPALVQEASITVHRDFDRNGFRTGDKLDTGLFGINQHHANDASRHDIGPWSAGCLVGRFNAEHEQFMKIIMQDRRYKLNKQYLFETTIIPCDDLLQKFPLI